MKRATGYPRWKYYPLNSSPPQWALDLVGVVRVHEPTISTLTLERSQGLKSDDVLRAIADGLSHIGYRVEASKQKAAKIRRPVLFGDEGEARLSYEVDAFHDGHGIVLEVEAGRGAMNNADYRDIIRASLIVGVRYLALLMPVRYQYNSSGKAATVEAYGRTRDQLDAIYASRRLELPFEGMLLIGY